MNTVEGSMEFFHMARNLCFGLAIAFALLAILTFVLFDIKSIFLIKTGRAKRKTIEEMNQRNQQTGKLRENTEREPGKTKESTAGKTVKEKAEKTHRNNGGLSRGLLRKDSVNSRSGTMNDISGKKENDKNHDPVHKGTVLLAEHESSRYVTTPSSFRVTKRIIVTHTDENIAV